MPAQKELQTARPVQVGTPIYLSLAAAAATGAGTDFHLGTARKDWGIWVSTTGSPGTVSIALESSPDNGATWNQMGASIVTAGFTQISNAVAVHVRLKLNTLSGGTAPTVTGSLAGY